MRLKKNITIILSVGVIIFFCFANWFDFMGVPRSLHNAEAAATYIQSATNAVRSTTISASFTAAPTQGNLLVAVAGNYVANTVSAPAGWQTALNQSNNAPGQAIFYKIAGAGESTTVTVGPFTTNDTLGLHIYEYSGIDQVSPLDQTASNSGTGTVANTGTTAPTTQANELIFGATISRTGNSTTWDNAFTQRNFFRSIGLNRISLSGADKNVTAIGSYTGNATYSASGAWRGQIVTFKAINTTYIQSGYRWFANQDSTDVGSPLAALNTAFVLTSAGDQFRLRALLYIGGVALPINGETFKLQYVGKGTGSCAVPVGGTPATYTDVTAATLIAYYNNPTPTDGSPLTANISDPTQAGVTIRNQTYEELNNFTNSVATIALGEAGMWDFSLYDNGAPSFTTYCFRVVKSNGVPLNTYSYYPEITTASTGSLSVDIVDSGGTSITTPSVIFSGLNVDFACQTATGTFGVAAEKIRVSNTTSNPSWTLTLAANTGPTAVWSSGTLYFDYNDSTGTPSGCADGTDTDTYAGLLSVDPTTITITPQTGCSNTGISLGTASSYSEGVTDNITLATAGGTTQTNCYWDLLNIGASQKIPAEQPLGAYSLDMTLTITAS